MVAPLVGAWIEIGELAAIKNYMKSLPLWERGLKYDVLGLVEGIKSRSPCGSVD